MGPSDQGRANNTNIKGQPGPWGTMAQAHILTLGYIYNFIIYYFLKNLCVHVSVLCACTGGCLQQSEDSLGLKLQAVLSSPAWVLGMNLKSSATAAGILNW